MEVQLSGRASECKTTLRDMNWVINEEEESRQRKQ